MLYNILFLIFCILIDIFLRIKYKKINNNLYKYIEKDPYNIQFIKNPNEDLLLYIVKKNGLNLKYINNQTKKICIAAVSQNGLAIQYVKKIDEDIIFYAILENINAVDYIESYMIKI